MLISLTSFSKSTSNLPRYLTLILIRYEYFICIPHWLWARYVPQTHHSSSRALNFLGKLVQCIVCEQQFPVFLSGALADVSPARTPVCTQRFFNHTDFLLTVRTFCQAFWTAVLFTEVPESFFWHIQNPHDQTVLTNIRLYRPILSQAIAKAAKNDQRGFCWFLVPKSSAWIIFVSLNDYCTAHKRHREPILVWLEFPDHGDSEYARKNFLAHLWTKQQFKMSGNTIFCC